MSTLFHANPRSAYLGGFFTGTHPMSHLLDQGDFGLGGLDRNDGELVVLDGTAYRTAEDGTTQVLPPEATTPYAAVTRLEASTTFEVDGPLGKEAFEQQLGARLPLTNRIWAMRIHGEFGVVRAGASGPQTPPYRPLMEVFEDYNWIDHRATIGTLVSFSSPAFLLGLDFVGHHYHWLSDDLRQGGHVVDFEVTQVEVSAVELSTFAVDVADDDDLRGLDLTPRN